MNFFEQTHSILFRFMAVFLALALACPPMLLRAQSLNAPAVVERAALTSPFQPVLLNAVRVDPKDPLRFEFFVNDGDADGAQQDYLPLVKDFLTALTISEKDLWVNLSPYEKDRIIDERFGLTTMGRDLLAQDHFLKQLTASLIYPEGEIGKRFWDEVYRQAYEKYGTTDVPVDVFNKVWIMPDIAEVYQEGMTAAVLKSRLKVILDSDHRAMQENGVAALEPSQELSKRSFYSIIIPLLEKEVNEGEDFARLRQIYHALILAAWYKRIMREGFLGKAYVDQARVKGVDQEDPGENLKIYRRYVDAFSKGAFNYIKEEIDRYTGEMIPRKYFSGGILTGDDFAEKLVIRRAGELGAAERKVLDASQNDKRNKKLDVALRRHEQQESLAAFKVETEKMRSVVEDVENLSKMVEGLKAMYVPSDDPRIGFNNKKLKETQNNLEKMIQGHQADLQWRASAALKFFLQGQKNTDMLAEEVAARNEIIEKIFLDMIAAKPAGSLRGLMLDGTHTEVVFNQFMVVAEFMRPAERISYVDVVRRMGLNQELAEPLIKLIKSFKGDTQYAELYKNIFKKIIDLGPEKSLFAREDEVNDLSIVVADRLMESARDKRRGFWSTEFSGSRDRNRKVAEAIREAESLEPNARRFVESWVPVKRQMSFFRIKEPESAQGKVHGKFPVIAELQDFVGWMTVYDDMFEMEKAGRKLLGNSVNLRVWKRLVKSEMDILEAELRLKTNRMKPAVRRSKELRLDVLREQLRKKADDNPILVEFDNKFVSNQDKKYYAALHYCFVLDNNLEGENNWTSEGQMHTLLQVLARYLDHDYIYKNQGEEGPLQEAIRIDNWLVNVVEVLNYLSHYSKLGVGEVKAFLNDLAANRSEAGVNNAQAAVVDRAANTGGIDVRDIEGRLKLQGEGSIPGIEQDLWRSLDNGDIAGFSPVIRSVASVQGIFSLN